MEQKLYLECYSGISGDMTVAALIDLGADQKILLDGLNSLLVKGFKVEISRVKKSGIDACDFNVIPDEKHRTHDHDMDYLHSTSHHTHHHDSEEPHTHHHGSEEPHTHHHESEEPHTHHHGSEEHHHEHRGMKEITEIINHADITDRAKEIALQIFQVIGEAEARAHAVDLDKVHFHEVGAVDSVVDIVATAICIDNLGIKEVVVPVLYEGTGTVRCQHGILPVPVPAVVNIASQHNLTIKVTDTRGELITPTGAAIVAALKTQDKLPEKFDIIKLGLGANKRNYQCPGLLRAMIIRTSFEEEKDVIYKLESNIDDCSGEVFGYVMNKLFEAGANDVNYMPLYMKKNRPAYQINIICKQKDINALEEILFRETTTIGVRRQKMERTILEREIVKFQTSIGEALVKVCLLHSGTRVYPEYESIVSLSRKHQLTYNEIYQLILKEYHEQF